MNNDIKEMTDKIKKCLIAGYDIDIINQEEMGILWNYITNLQEEHKNCTRKHWQQKCAEHYANEMIYKSRNKKAIEYIKEMCWIDKEYGYCNYGDDLRPEHIVNILEGEDKDE